MTSRFLLFSLVSSAILLVGCAKTPSAPAPQISPVPTASPVASSSATPSTTVVAQMNYVCQKGKTVFDSLFATGHVADYKTTSLGKLITSIDQKEEGNGKYWQYKVDGQEASIGADAYVCKGGETILWEMK